MLTHNLNRIALSGGIRLAVVVEIPIVVIAVVGSIATLIEVSASGIRVGAL